MIQNPHDTRKLVEKLEAAKGASKKSGKKGFSCKKSTFPVAGSNTKVDSWKFMDWDYKRSDLPTYARGLFTAKKSNGEYEIAIRGYDKFFNTGEVPETEWENINKNTMGPYELSVKENGCILFMSGLEDGTLLVCSKHSTGARQDVELSHAMVGEKWIERHVTSVGKTTKDLALALRAMNATAVGELCDDQFEEHVLAYPPELAGVYLHGVNFNVPEFKTLAGSEVHKFADEWGFKKADYQMIETLEETKDFLAECAKTGSWNGRDTEGFVVRCKMKDKEDWFFKYKFEEPYLMYRQWRECTKQIIAGKNPKIKKHKTITEEYLLYARRQLHANRDLGKQYNNNHGIIAMRDGFLAFKGKKGSDIIAEEEEEQEKNPETRNIVLVPIASIGCGKTTVANALVKLFDWGHVQNDNIKGKNRPAQMTTAVTNLMAEYPVVISDRNNAEMRERKQIIEDVQTIIPETRFVALHWVHDPKDKMMNKIRKITQDRVFARGDNHQTIHAGSDGQAKIAGIMDNFLYRFEGCKPDRYPDSQFDEIINLDVAASPQDTVETVINQLYTVYPHLFKDKDMPTHEDIAEATKSSMNEIIGQESKHDLSGKADKAKRDGAGLPKENSQVNGDTRLVQQPAKGRRQAIPQAKDASPDYLIKNLEYFGISLSVTGMNSILNNLFAGQPDDISAFYQQLKKSKRTQTEYHVTLIHRANAQDNPDLWSFYTNLYRSTLESSTDFSERTPSLGPARLRLERVIWDGRVMGVLVRLLPSGPDAKIWQSTNDYPHITIGTATQDIKPVETNDLMQRWANSDAGDAGIQNLEIPDVKEIDGVVRPVLQRGR